MEQKLCECGCGLPTPLAKQTDKRRGHIKGQPMCFLSGHISDRLSFPTAELKLKAARQRNNRFYATHRDSRDTLFYNLLPGERELIRKFQGGNDPISGAPLIAAAHMDHDHKTGLVRGLLNPMTNKFLVDNEQKLLAMLHYIQNPPAPQALGEKVFGLVGQAMNKKKMLYGPEGTATPLPRQKRK